MEEEEGRKHGHAKGPPGRGKQAGPSWGRAEAAPRRAHTRTHALPLHPRPLPAGGAARRPRGTVQPVGDARQLQGRSLPSPLRPPRAPCHPAPTVCACSPPPRDCLGSRPVATNPGARGLSSPHPRKKESEAAAERPDLVSRGILRRETEFL
jgi:hypothetical protein